MSITLFKSFITLRFSFHIHHSPFTHHYVPPSSCTNNNIPNMMFLQILTHSFFFSLYYYHVPSYFMFIISCFLCLFSLLPHLPHLPLLLLLLVIMVSTFVVSFQFPLLSTTTTFNPLHSFLVGVLRTFSKSSKLSKFKIPVMDLFVNNRATASATKGAMLNCLILGLLLVKFRFGKSQALVVVSLVVVASLVALSALPPLRCKLLLINKNSNPSISLIIFSQFFFVSNTPCVAHAYIFPALFSFNI